MRLKAFIGSSSENLNVANAIKHSLEPDVECTVWTDSFFRLSKTAIESLSGGVDAFDMGIFVFGGDDSVISRGTTYIAPRDNVIFEYGLFCGRLGLQRSFVVRSKDKGLKWMSDLEGFTVALYDESLAKTNADKAVEEACKQVREQLVTFNPKPGIFVEGKWRRFGTDLWTYAGSETSSTVTDEDGLQFLSENNTGLRYPKIDNLSSAGRFCVFRAMALMGASPRLYVALFANNERIFLSIAQSHAKEGWGVPRNEFMIRLPNLEPNRYQKFVLDIKSLERFIGPGAIVTGFRLRPGLKLSHFGVCDVLPVWLKDAPVLSGTSAPSVTIDFPSDGSIVGHEEVLNGTFENLSSANDIQVFVFSPDNNWYVQGPTTIANGRWSRRAYFGNPTQGAGREFQVAVLAGVDGAIENCSKQLPNALARSIIKVIRKN